MWVLIHTQPKSSRLLIRMARPKSFVQTLEASSYSTPLAQAMAWSSSVNRCTVITGPKISRWIISSSWRSPATTVGSMKKPRSPWRAPPGGIWAWSGARSGKRGGGAGEEAGDVRQLGGVVHRRHQGVGVGGAVGVGGRRGASLLGERGEEV